MGNRDEPIPSQPLIQGQILSQQQPEFTPFLVKYLNAPHVGGHQINRSVEDVLIQCAVTALANE